MLNRMRRAWAALVDPPPNVVIFGVVVGIRVNGEVLGTGEPLASGPPQVWDNPHGDAVGVEAKVEAPRAQPCRCGWWHHPEAPHLSLYHPEHSRAQGFPVYRTADGWRYFTADLTGEALSCDGRREDCISCRGTGWCLVDEELR